jgi:hypothetical protein
MKRTEQNGRPNRAVRTAIAFAGVVLFFGACDSPTDPPIPTSLEPMSAVVQNAEAGEPVAAAPTILLLDQRGKPVSGAAVTFEVVSGAGVLVSGSSSAARLTVETDASGQAAVPGWRVGALVGANEVLANVGGLTPVRFTAGGIAGPAARIEAWEWLNPTGRVMEKLPGTPSVRVTDRHGNPVSGAAVSFHAEGGSVARTTGVTGGDGVASANGWTLGPVSGEQVLHATTGALSTTLVSIAQPGPAAVLLIGAGNGQAATVGTTVTTAPTVIVKDVHGNRTGGASVAFEIVSGGGRIGNAQGVLASTSFTQDVDALGNASVTQWTLGTRAGLNKLRATLNGTGVSVTFDAQGLAAAAASMGAFQGNGQSAATGTAVAIAPAVLVTDAHDNPVPNVAVTFAVTAGGGSVTGALATTNISGVAVAGAWILGAHGANSLSASSAGLGTVSFQATAWSGSGGSGGSGGTGGSSGGGYGIEVRFTGSMPGSQQAIFDAAAGWWTRAISGDLPSVPMSVPAGACGVPHAAINEVVDDLIIFVAVSPIDGPGKILGSAGPCFIRSGGLPVLGVMYLDAADVDQMQINGTLEAVVAHEMGHILGVGTMWGGMVVGAGSSDPYFTGGAAVSAFLASGGSGYPGNPVPVENTGGPGTRDSHWRESVFGSELMTGWINGASAPLSSVTLASLVDLGYTVKVNLSSGFGAGGLGVHGADEGPQIEIREGPPLVTPITVDSRGRRMIPVQR